MRSLDEALVGIDGFPKIAEVLDLSGGAGGDFVNIKPDDMIEKGTLLCQRNWNDLHADFSHYMPYRSQRACFGAVFIYYLLVDVYGINRDDSKTFKTLGYEADISWTFGAALKQALQTSTTSYDIPFSVSRLEEF